MSDTGGSVLTTVGVVLCRDSGSKAKKMKTKKARDIVDVYFENTTVYLAEGALDGVVGVGVGVGCGKLLVAERHCGEIEVGASCG